MFIINHLEVIKVLKIGSGTTPAVRRQEKGYTWVIFGCKYPALVGQLWMQINSPGFDCHPLPPSRQEFQSCYSVTSKPPGHHQVHRRQSTVPTLADTSLQEW